MSDVIVIGGGLSGLLVARELALAAAKVTLVERGAVGREASWAGGGILSPLYPWRYPAPVDALVRWSQEHYPGLCAELAQDTGIDPQWTPSGMWILDTHELEAARAWALRNGRIVERIASPDVATKEPAVVAPDGALWLPHVGQVRNPRLLRALFADIQRRGVTVVEHASAGELVVESDRPVGVKTANQWLPADQVVVTAGAWSRELLGRWAADVNVFPVKGQMLLYRLPPDTVRGIVLSEGRYVVPRRDGHVLVGSTMEETGFDKSTTAAARAALAGAGAELIPVLASHEPVQHWAGLRPGSPQGVPYIGRVGQIEGVFINAGHFRNGVVMGPAAARLTADVLLGRRPFMDVGPYQPAVPRVVP